MLLLSLQIDNGNNSQLISIPDINAFSDMKMIFEKWHAFQYLRLKRSQQTACATFSDYY